MLGFGIEKALWSRPLLRIRSGYVERMARAISVRLEDAALRALSQLEATGMTRSEAIRAALAEAAPRLHDQRAPAAEVAALDADDDRAEMVAVAELMESLRGRVISSPSCPGGGLNR